MSLVICSNQDADGQGDRQRSSVYKPWAFRNTLSSTYKIPADAQVALQSCKVNIDGRVVISESNSKFFQYFGKKLNLDGVTSPQSEDTTSYPVYTDFLQSNEQGVLELSVDDFANVIQSAIRKSTFHPNVKEQPTCEVLRNASSLDFLGYKITYDQKTDKTSNVPADNTFEQWYRKDGQYADENGSGIFTYAGGVFTRTTDAPENVCTGICPSLPMHNLTGEFTVDIGGSSGRANASGVEWHVGLSRYINNTDQHGFYYPSYSDYFMGDPIQFNEEIYVDFAIARDANGDLIVYEHAYDSNFNGLVQNEVQYWLNASSAFAGAGRTALNASFTQAKLEVEGEIVKAKIYDGSWKTITEYKSDEDKVSYFRPVHQADWCLHPVLSVGQKTGATDCTLQITQFNGVALSDYDPKTPYKGGWFETMELENSDRLCQELESRPILEPGSVVNYEQLGVNASDGVADYDHVLILQQSEVYKVSPGANAAPILGFNGAIIDTPNTIVDLNQKTYQSNFAPDLTNSLSMFVRLNNFGQNCTNARVGNRSKILAHLTDLETTSGRQTYEPKNLIYLDLDNPSELNVNEFDISFCYANEQFAQTLTGQSIVCLYFRPKPKL
jgi:hypothetical protein